MAGTHTRFINYETDPLKIITKHEINRLNGLLFRMETAKRLCESAGAEVIHEFGFKGDLNAVREQLIELLDRYAIEGIHDSERPRLIENETKRLKWYADENKSNEYYSQKIKEYHRAGNLDKMHDMLAKQRLRTINLHNKKECLCFTN